MGFIDIEGIRVYDPKLDEKVALDHKGYKNMMRSDFDKARSLCMDLRQRVLNSFVGNGITLRDYLYGTDGYFARHALESEVLFINGSFLASSTIEEGFDSKLKEIIADKNNGIPFVFRRHAQSPDTG